MLVIIALTYHVSALLLELRATTKCEFLRHLSAPGGSWCRIHCPVALQQCHQLPGLDWCLVPPLRVELPVPLMLLVPRPALLLLLAPLSLVLLWMAPRQHLPVESLRFEYPCGGEESFRR